MLESQAGCYRSDRGRAARRGLGVAGILAAGIIAFGGLASEASAQFELESYSLRLGWNTGAINTWSTFGGEIRRSREYSRGSIGFHAGAAAYYKIAEIELPSGSRRHEVMIPYVVGLDPSAMIVSKGGKNNSRLNLYNANGYLVDWYYSTWTVSAYYLDIHVPISFKREFKGAATKVGVGPYVGIGLFGEQTYDVPNYRGGTTWTAPTFGNDGIGRLDGGVVYDVSFELIDMFLLGFRGTYGLTSDGVRSLFITFGYIIKAAGSSPNAKYPPAND